MATKLIKAPDGTIWYAGRSGYIPVKSDPKEEKVKKVELIVPEKEPEPPKKKHKTYKLHYTKEWRGTYGEFVNTFGNENFPHGGSSFTEAEAIGNLYFIYSPGGHSYVCLNRIVGDKYYYSQWRGSGSLKPGESGFPKIGDIYAHLGGRIDAHVTKGKYFPLCSPFTPPEEIVEKEEVKQQEEEVKVEVEKEKRECSDPNCSWCFPSESIEEVTPKSSTPGMPGCPICSGHHEAFQCKMGGVLMGIEYLWETHNWKNPFCGKCGSMEHEQDVCDWTPPPTCGVCGYAGHKTSECAHNSNGTGYKYGNAEKGNMVKPPWEKRGIKIDYAEPPDEPYTAIWPMESDKWDPLVENARLILLEFIAENVRHPTREAKYASMNDLDVRMIVQEGQQRLEALVKYVEPRLRAYTDMAVGGELRHHRAVGGKVIPGPGSREMAWKSWKAVRNILGPQGLLDAAVLFEDFGGRSYGGVKWGIPAKILWMRETGQIPGVVFLDRVFDLEHNGGAFLNKVHWKREDRNSERFNRGKKLVNRWGDDSSFGIEYIKLWLGPARMEDEVDWSVILFFAPVEDRVLFREYWERSNAIWRDTHLPPLEIPRMRNIVPGTAYVSNLSLAALKKKKDKLIEFYPFIHKVNEYGCPYCGKEPGSKYYCEDQCCPVNALWSENLGLGAKARSCTSHFSNCEACGGIICFAHEYHYCSECLEKKKTMNKGTIPKDLMKNPKYTPQVEKGAK